MSLHRTLIQMVVGLPSSPSLWLPEVIASCHPHAATSMQASFRQETCPWLQRASLWVGGWDGTLCLSVSGDRFALHSYTCMQGDTFSLRATRLQRSRSSVFLQRLIRSSQRERHAQCIVCGAYMSLALLIFSGTLNIGVQCYLAC